MNTTHKILVVEPDPGMQELLRLNLQRSGYEPVLAVSSASALESVMTMQPSLLLLEWYLWTDSGLDLVYRLRAQKHELPIIMLTDRSGDSDKVSAFNAGVDDFVVKPFHVRELLSRIKSKVRRFSSADDESSRLELDGLCLYPKQNLAIYLGRRIELQPAEFTLLHALSLRPMQVLNRSQLIELVHGYGSEKLDRHADSLLVALRRKLERDGLPRCIETVRGVGYRFLPASLLDKTA